MTENTTKSDSTRNNPPVTGVIYKVIKGGFDVVFSISVIALSLPLAAVVAAAIKLSSPGPVLFRQQRTGYRGTPFTLYKFRTMTINSAADSRSATPEDARITAVGRFLRHTSIDELPQFINVLRGDMSVVGPRPHMLSQTEQYRRLIDRYMMRHHVKPGITGWAQINGCRGCADSVEQMERRVEHDVWYIQHCSFPLDLKIVGRTIVNILRGDPNAY